MALLTGQEYRHSLRDGRRVFLSGEEVADVTKHPAIKPMVDTMVQVLRDLAGGAAVMVPDQETLANAELRADIESTTASTRRVPKNACASSTSCAN